MDLTWDKLEVTGALTDLFQCYGFSTANLVGARIYVYGGTVGSARQNSLFVYDVATRRWSSLEPGFEEIFPYRSMHTSVLVGDQLMVFGGFNRGNKTDILLSFDLVLYKWEVVEYRGPKPPATVGHSSCYVPRRNSIIVFSRTNESPLGSLFEYRLDLKEWRQLETSGEEPVGRWKHASALYGQYWFIYGGTSPGASSFPPHDLFILDTKPAVPCWSKVKVHPDIPRTLEGPMVFFRGKLLLYFPEESSGRLLWVFDPRSRTCNKLLAPEDSGASSSGYTVRGEFPKPRFANMMVSTREQVFLFGGHEDSLENMHVLKPSTKITQ